MKKRSLGLFGIAPWTDSSPLTDPGIRSILWRFPSKYGNPRRRPLGTPRMNNVNKNQPHNRGNPPRPRAAAPAVKPPNLGNPHAGAVTGRHWALKLLMELEESELFLGAALENEGIPSQARPIVRELVTGVLRNRELLDYNLAPLLHKPLTRLDPPVRTALRVALYERTFLKTHAAIIGNEYAGLMRAEHLESAVGFVNAIARRLPDALDRLPPEQDAVAYLAVRYSQPRWAIQRWLRRFGRQGCEALCAFNNTQAPLCLRVNILRAPRRQVLDSLLTRGIEAALSPLARDGIVVRGGGATGWPEWNEGLLIAQDDAAQLVSLLAAPLPGQIVIDAAAAPGGKTTHLAQMMGDRGRIHACDAAPGRLKLVTANARRLGLACIETHAGEFTALAPQLPEADLVLLDAPCLGTGTWRRRPDARWRKDPKQLAGLVKLQRQLLDAAATRVRPGGAIVYATCSLEPEENEEQILGWLRDNPAWHIEAPGVDSGVPIELVAGTGWIATVPYRDGCDGMFAVKLRKS